MDYCEALDKIKSKLPLTKEDIISIAGNLKKDDDTIYFVSLRIVKKSGLLREYVLSQDFGSWVNFKNLIRLLFGRTISGLVR